MRDAHVDPGFISGDIVDTIGNCLDGVSRFILVRKVMRLDLDGSSLAAPLSSGILVLSDDFLFLGVNRERRLPRSLQRPDPGTNVAKLGVPVRMLLSLDRLAVGLQTETRILEQFGNGGMTDNVSAFLQLRREFPCALTCPFQR